MPTQTFGGTPTQLLSIISVSCSHNCQGEFCDFLVVVVTQDPISIESHPTKQRRGWPFIRPDVPIFLLESRCRAPIQFSCRNSWP
jgi:hypothetical protein